MPRPSRSGSAFLRPVLSALIVLVALSTSSCVATPPGPRPVNNLRLTIGTLLPAVADADREGPGPRTLAAVSLAVSDIVEAHAGITVETIPADGTAPKGSAGTAVVAAAAEAATTLLGDGVSAVIGTAASGLSKVNVERFSRAGVVQVSPADGDSELSTSPDEGLYWRTAPTDTLRGHALGNRIISDGALRVGILYANDSASAATQAGLVDALEAGGAVGFPEIFEPGATDFTGPLDRILRQMPGAIVVVSGPELLPIAAELDKRMFELDRLYGVDRNIDALQGQPVDAAGAKFAIAGASTPTALAARLPTVDTAGVPAPIDRSFSPEAYDATILLALAALAGGSSDGTVISSNLRAVASGGTACSSFDACSRLIAAGTNIDYQGQSGSVSWNDRGDLTVAQSRIYRYADQNVPEFLGLATSQR